MSVDYHLIGQKIKEKRKLQHKTQEAVAEAISVTVGYISQIERGITHINLETLSNIAEILDCDIVDFLGGTVKNTSMYLLDDLEQSFSKLSASNRKSLLEISQILLQNQ